MLGFTNSRRPMSVLLMIAFAPSAAMLGQPPVPAQHSGTSTETLTYTIEWRLITAGSAKIENTGSHLTMHLESAGLVSKLYKVDDTYNVNYDPGYCATSLHLDATEGRRKRDTRVTFERNRKKADYLERDMLSNSVVKQTQIDVPSCVHDIAGALISLQGARIDLGHSMELPVSDGKKVAMVRVEAQEKEQVKIKGKNVPTVRYEGFLFNNIIYSRKARLFIWFTDDARKTPVQIQIRMNFPIGTVTLTLDKEEHS